MKQENKSDSKLGFSTTVNQSWPTGDATATGSFNLDTTQSEAHDTTYKRMREQTEKISQEIRSSYKSTFKTTTESTDVSSKRYVISNPGTKLQNYELRRKMRRVAVQVQDIGTYLCWETFVDDPARELGLANLVHIAKQPDITPPPYPTDLPTPERKPGIPFDVKVSWAGEDRRVGAPGDRANRPEGILLGHRKITVDVPDGYAFELQPGQVFQLQCVSARGEGQFGSYQYLAKYLGGSDIEVILGWGQGGLDWDEPNDIDLRGTVALAPTQALRDHIANANEEARAKVDQAVIEQQAKATEAAFYAAAQERIELAVALKKRRFEDLREEERTVVYRRLIADLMAGSSTDPNHWYKAASPRQRHAYATVLNAIFDIDRMLYFVAPEWWQPRARSGLVVGDGTYEFGPDKVVAWSGQAREDNYLITGKSEPARLGSSLGWLLQLDGDDQRNRFLNASWVRAVMPVRPGKEEAAMSWLTKADVEGTEGLGFAYAGNDDEADEIIDGLDTTPEPAQDPPTVGDAIRYLTTRVAEKHVEGRTEALFPDRAGIADGDKVWSTPIDKVYEHGFYPLERSFRASPTESRPTRRARTSRSWRSGPRCCPPTRSCPWRWPTTPSPAGRSRSRRGPSEDHAGAPAPSGLVADNRTHFLLADASLEAKVGFATALSHLRRGQGGSSGNARRGTPSRGTSPRALPRRRSTSRTPSPRPGRHRRVHGPEDRPAAAGDARPPTAAADYRLAPGGWFDALGRLRSATCSPSARRPRRPRVRDVGVNTLVLDITDGWWALHRRQQLLRAITRSSSRHATSLVRCRPHGRRPR